MQYYRYDRLQNGNAILRIVDDKQTVIERQISTVRKLYKWRQENYPNAHNYRHHFQGENGCPTCDKDDRS